MPTPSLPYRALGSTGERVSAIGLGGWQLGLPQVSAQLAIRLVRSAIDEGINFLDNSWDYNDGASEARVGKAKSSQVGLRLSTRLSLRALARAPLRMTSVRAL